MDILIDGYNLLNCAGIVVESSGAYTLEKSRQALLNFLIATLPGDQRVKTTVVFDGKNAPRGLPSRYSQAGITILFADRKEDADTLIARLVVQHSAPKSLMVVSSDHGVQRAAKRRKAQFCDSDRWFFSALRQRNQPPAGATADEKPYTPLSPSEVAAWVDKFELESGEIITPQRGALPDPDADRTDHSGADPESTHELDGFNPFPEGYGEDLLP